MTSSNPLVTLDGSSLTFTVKNKRPKTNINVTKKWFDDNGQEVQVQNGSITYDLMQVAITDNGRTSEKVYLAGERLTKADNWTKSYGDLPLTGKTKMANEVTFSLLCSGKSEVSRSINTATAITMVQSQRQLQVLRFLKVHL